MLIDWFTVAAQFVNFLVLVAILKRLFYRPILNAMAAREERIATALRDAADKKNAADEQLKSLQQQQQQLEIHRTKLLQQSADEAQRSKLQLIASAQQEVNAMRQRWFDAVEREKERIERNIVLTLQSELLSLIRTIVRDLAGLELEDAVAQKFVDQLRTMPANEIAKLRSDAKSLLLVRTSFDLPPPAQSRCETAIHQQFGNGHAIRFETAPDLICGLELATTGYKVSWNVQDWLRSFENSLREILETTAHAHN